MESMASQKKLMSLEVAEEKMENFFALVGQKYL